MVSSAGLSDLRIADFGNATTPFLAHAAKAHAWLRCHPALGLPGCGCPKNFQVLESQQPAH